MTPEHQRTADEWTERIRARFAAAISPIALRLAEKVGEHYEPTFDEEDEDDE